MHHRNGSKKEGRRGNMSQCKICGTAQDLFLACTGEGVCSICKLKFIGGLTATQERINQIRAGMGLKDGQFLEQDNGKEAGRILKREG